MSPQGRSGLRLVLARSPAEFEAAAAGRRESFRIELRVDFAFIVAYWSIYAATSALFGTRGFWGAPWLAAIAGELATIGAIADVSENLHALQLLDRQTSDPETTVRRMRRSSLAKWASLFAAASILSVMFFERGGLDLVLALDYALAAALGFAAIVAEALGIAVPDRVLELTLRTAFFGACSALTIGLAVAASQT